MVLVKIICNLLCCYKVSVFIFTIFNNCITYNLSSHLNKLSCFFYPHFSEVFLVVTFILIATACIANMCTCAALEHRNNPSPSKLFPLSCDMKFFKSQMKSKILSQTASLPVCHMWHKIAKYILL